jgi:hypothetical protein
MKFGQTDKSDFMIPPFAFFYFYIVFAAAFGFPTVSRQAFFQSAIVSWVGVVLLGSHDLPAGGHVVVSSPSQARRAIPHKTLRTGIYGLLPPSEEILLKPPGTKGLS